MLPDAAGRPSSRRPLCDLVRSPGRESGAARRRGSRALLPASVRRASRLARRAPERRGGLGRARRHRRGRVLRGRAEAARRRSGLGSFGMNAAIALTPREARMSMSSNNGRVGRPRGIGFGILLFIVTFGFYGWYWVFKTQEETKEHTGQGLGGVLGLVVWILISAVSAFVIPSAKTGGRRRSPAGRVYGSSRARSS